MYKNRHVTSQVDFIPVSDKDPTSKQLGTLYNGPSISTIHTVGLKHSSDELSQHGNFNSESHTHNVLAVQGNYVASTTLTSFDSQHQSRHCQQKCKEGCIDVPTTEIPDINMDQQTEFDIPSLDGSEYMSEGDDVQHHIDPDILLFTQDKINAANIDSCITREEYFPGGTFTRFWHPFISIRQNYEVGNYGEQKKVSFQGAINQ
jgi:hypothetical protein